jgi:hypothetical protein
MVAKYYVAVRPRTNDYHPVHKEGCPFLYDDGKKIYLGLFKSGQDAIKESHVSFERTENCLFCCKEEKVASPNTVIMERKETDNVPVGRRVPVSNYQGMFCCLN